VNKKAIKILAACVTLVPVIALTIALTASATVAQTDKTWNCLNPRAAAGEPRIAFTGTQDDAQAFFQQTELSETLGGVEVSQWTDGLPITIPTEQAVAEILTGTSHSSSEVMSVYTRTGPGQYAAGTTPAAFAPSGNTATVEQVAVNAVMAGCKPEYLPAVLAMMSGGPNYVDEVYPVGYWQFVAGPYSKEVGFNTGQGSMNPCNPPSMTIGRSFQLCLINLGGAIAGSTNHNMGTLFSRSMLCLAEDPADLPEGWVGANEDCGLSADESMIMLCASSSLSQGNFAPSSYRAMNTGNGGIANKLGGVGKPGKYNVIEYYMRWLGMPGEASGGVPVNATGNCGPTGPMVFVGPPSMVKDIHDSGPLMDGKGFATKNDFYQWVADRGVIPAADFAKYGWYDVLTNNGTAIEPTSGKPYNQLAPDYPVHVLGRADQQLISVHLPRG